MTIRETLLAILLALVCSTPAFAQEALPDIVIQPTEATFQFRMRTDGDVPIYAVGLVPCTVTTQPTADDVVFRHNIPNPADGLVVVGTATVVLADGDTCFKGVSFGESDRISNLTENSYQIQLLTLPPVLLP